MKGRLPAVILLSLWCLASGGVSVASAEDPTIEKCTCDLDKNKQPDNGATVVNASACWATEDTSRQWCEIAVAYLEGSKGKRDLVVGLVSAANSNGEAVATQLKAELDTFANAFSQTPSSTKFSPDDIRGAVGGLIDKYTEQIAACVKQFGKKDAEFKPQEGDGFACTVGETTGWLRIEFQVGETRFIYMVAPNA